MTAPTEQIKFLNFPPAGTSLQENGAFPPFSVYVSPEYTDGPVEIVFMRKYTEGGRRGTTTVEQELGLPLTTISTPGTYVSPSQVSINLPLIKDILNTITGATITPQAPGLWGTSFYMVARSVSNPTTFTKSTNFAVEMQPQGTYITIKTPRSGQAYTAGEAITIEWLNTWKDKGFDLNELTDSKDAQVTFDVCVGGPGNWISQGTIGTASVNTQTFTGTLPSNLEARGDYRVRSQITFTNQALKDQYAAAGTPVGDIGEDYGSFFQITTIANLIQRTDTLSQLSLSISAQVDSMLAAVGTPAPAESADSAPTVTVKGGGGKQTRKRKQKKRGSRRRKL